MLCEEDAARAKAGKVVLPDSPSTRHHSRSKVSELRALHEDSVSAHRATRDRLYRLIDLHEEGKSSDMIEFLNEIIDISRRIQS